MVVVAIIILVMLLLLAGLLVTPVTLYVDTDRDRYEIFQFPVFRFYIKVRDGAPVPTLKLLGINMQLKSRSRPEPKPKQAKTGKRQGRSLDAWRFLIEYLLKSLKVRRAVADLDTGNVVLNAHLVPVFLLASRDPVALNINFSGRVYFHLEVSGRPGRMVWIFLKFLTKK